MKKRKALLVAFLLVWVGGHSSVRGEVISDRVAAVVNSDVILESDIKKAKQPLMRSFMSLPLGVIRPGTWPTDQEILEELVVIHLLEQDANKKGMKIDDKILDASIDSIKKRNNLTQDQFVLHLVASGVGYPEYRKLMKRQLTLNRLIAAEVAQKVPLSEEDAQEYFKKYKDNIDERHKQLLESLTPARPQEQQQKPEIPKDMDIYVGGKVRLRQITLKPPQGAKKQDLAKVMDQARTIYQEASTGGDFAQLAKKYSKDPMASSGGDLGMLNYKDMVPDLQKLVQRFKEGDVVPPMPSRDGVIILYLAEGKNRTKKTVPIPVAERNRMEKQLKEAYEKRNAEQTKKAQSEARAAEEETEIEDPKGKTEKSTGILTPAEEKEYKKVRRKVLELVKTERIQARMKDWIEELKKNSIIEVKL
ncbi:MAG: peptidylprolyl isomerase [Desulfomonile tiedjei]|uniref:Peptidylprolyl isomerase n=1 Tax=Desulfomonile tiedjei TaxID=2358 RepID=A0A9D6Z7G8_9BACT|nr:peptidylprolyl isomerase [Desulfomonile tiedjei]